MKTWVGKILILATTAACLSACQKPTRTKEVTWETQPNSQSQVNQGGIDSGGGNGIDGRLLESFIQDPQADLGPTSTWVKSLLDRINKIYPPLAADFAHILHDRDWYFLPVKLKCLKAASIDVYVNDVDLDQFALQNSKEIYFDDSLFKQATEDNRERVVLHEMVMGVMIMQFTDTYDHCMAQASEFLLTDKSKYNSASNKCSSTYQLASLFPINKGLVSHIRLSNDDYHAVRNLTSKLFKHPDQVTAPELQGILRDQFGRDYDRWWKSQAP